MVQQSAGQPVRILISVMAYLFLVNCTQTSFRATPEKAGDKTAKISQTSVFNGSDSSQGATGRIFQPIGQYTPPLRDAAGTLVQPGQPARDAGGNIVDIRLPVRDASGNIVSGLISNLGTTTSSEQPRKEQAGAHVPAEGVNINRTCSDNQSSRQTNAKAAFASGRPIELIYNDQVCSANAATVMNIIKRGKLLQSDLQALCPSLFSAAADALANIRIDGAVSEKSGRSGRLEVLWARNQDGAGEADAADEYCDQHSSPLVVHAASDPAHPQPIALSSPEDGILFDLLGAQNNHVPVRISWFTNRDYRFLALPDARGEVRGIDQLFGNATRGPDGKFADNGYAALAKYDGRTADGMFQVARADGVIDARDPVYYKLRLWLDANRDGHGRGRELVSLRTARIAFIDLRFSNEYEENDQYGNITKMKSVVGLYDGSLDLIFDLWFKY